jgi:uncharacterized spore protein YtfJ
MSLSDVIKTALDQIHYIAKTETVVGEPICAGKVILIPVSKVSIGFAAGGGGKEDRSNSGAATGGGAQVTPIAFISITDDKVQVHPLSKADPNLNKILAMAPELIKKVSSMMGKKNDKAKGTNHPADETSP